MATTHVTARIPSATVERIERLARERSQTQTQVLVELLDLGLSKLEEDEIDAGFALLGEPEMQDMGFPTAPQREAMRRVD